MAEQDNPSVGADISSDKKPAARRLAFGPSFQFYWRKSITLDLTDEICRILSELMNQTNHAPDELFIRSLLLYKTAIDAEESGKRIAIVDSDDEIDQEITGL